MRPLARSHRLTTASWLLATWVLQVGLAVGAGEDWPQFQQNTQRNAKTAERLPTESLRMAWQRQDAGPPNPAWYGPARWDAYAGLRGLKSMRDYDPVYHPIVVGDRAWFGSSVDDTLYCVDLATGATVWSYVTDGPLRTAPSFAEGRIYFGSDDGYAYCLDAASGSLLWRFAPQETARRIMNNGRFISPWPIRTGVTLEAGRAYFGASLLPWAESYLCSVDAATGSADGAGHFVQRIEEATMEGPLAILPGRHLVSPQGRVPPRLFALADGQPLGSLKGGGGSFVVLTKDSVFHGPGNKTGWITASSVDSLDTVASFKNGNAMVVAGDISFILTDDRLTAANYATRKELWSVDCDCPLSLILAGNTLFVGGQDRIRGLDVATGQERWSHRVSGKVYSLVAAQGHLLAATDDARLYAFRADGTGEYLPLAPLPTSSIESDEVPEGLLPALTDVDEQLLGHWVFQRPYVSGMTAKNLAQGPDAVTDTRHRLVRLGEIQALKSDASAGSWKVADVTQRDALPTEALTASAWVRIDEAQSWSGFAACFQDNGSYERGWLLGANDDHFCFGLCGSAKNRDGLTFIGQPANFSLGGWHHVVGTYDGSTMRLYVDGVEVASGDQEQGAIHYPEKGAFVLGAYEDDNEKFPVLGHLHEVRVYRRALTAEEIRGQYEASFGRFPAPVTPDAADAQAERLAWGPLLRFVRPSVGKFVYETHEPIATVLTLYHDDQIVQRVTTAAGQAHQVELSGLERNTIYQYQIQFTRNGRTVHTPEYECDTHFDYTLDRGVHNAEVSEQVAEQLAAIQANSGQDQRQALCLVLGCDTGELMRGLAASQDWRIIAVDDDPSRVARLRRELAAAGLYGVRVTVHPVDSLARVPFTSHIANVITSERSLGQLPDLSPQEVERLLAPRGRAVLANSTQAAASDGGSGEGSISAKENPPAANSSTVTQEWQSIAGNQSASPAWIVLQGRLLSGAGEWSHIYGTSANSHYGGEALGQVRTTEELDVQWIGRPGADYQADRNGRKPPPLATGGRIFLQGLHRILALDQYNGTILWSIEIPEMDRYNMPRDCGNWCADEESVYVAVQDTCWRLDAARGELLERLPVARPAASASEAAEQPYDWGYIAREGELLVGSAVRAGTSWDSFWGNESWYDAPEGPVTYKVCSDAIFARDLETSRVKWEYRDGAIVNSTITIGDGVVYFVESRGEHLRTPSRRLGDEPFWNNLHLVALDATTGVRRWDHPLQIQPGITALYASYSQRRLVLVSSAQRNYFLYAFDGSSGLGLWNNQLEWGKGKADHGSHLSRPAIVGNQLYVRPGVFDLETGRQLPLTIPVGGCGTYACTDTALFFRAGSGKNAAVWAKDNGEYTLWNRLRPDCWLSTIPAGGMLLSPEGGGGCSCGNWMETSVGFLPRSVLSPAAQAPAEPASESQ